MVTLDKLARQLPTDEARAELFHTAESLMHIAAGKGAFIGAFGVGPMMDHDNTKKHSDELGEWTGYLAEQARKYQG
jgi:hypothetical protein